MLRRETFCVTIKRLVLYNLLFCFYDLCHITFIRYFILHYTYTNKGFNISIKISCQLETVNLHCQNKSLEVRISGKRPTIYKLEMNIYIFTKLGYLAVFP